MTDRLQSSSAPSAPSACSAPSALSLAGCSVARRALSLAAALVVVFSSGCGSRSSSGEGGSETAASRGIIIVNAPATGVVRRVLAREGMALNEGAALLEIAVPVEGQSAPPAKTENPQLRAGRNIQAAQGEIEAARAEVVRTEIEVQRLTPLAANGEAPQGQLDGARAEYERAQQRLQRATAGAQEAQAGLVAARQPSRNTTPALSLPAEQIVTVRASANGTLSAINARVGERVSVGQPLATIRADER